MFGFFIYRASRKEEERAVFNEMQLAAEKCASFSYEVLNNSSSTSKVA